ncbi:MAG: histidinol-phosphatase HisJ family protein [Armatimonadota bacterium]
MTQQSSYHVHSLFSDGRQTILEIVQGAVDLGLKRIGISDHFVYPSSGRKVCWSMALEDLDTYFEQLSRARETFGDAIDVRFGLECDFEPDTADSLADILQRYPLDYVIGSMHFLGDFPIDDRREHWDRLSQEERDNVMRRYWRRMADLARSGLFDFVGHIDLCKKFGHQPSVDLSPEIDTALEAIAESGIAVEVNTSGLFMPVREAYPSPAILRKCRERDVPVLITADAHSVADLTRRFDEGIRLVLEAGYSHLAEFERRSMRFIPLAGVSESRT